MIRHVVLLRFTRGFLVTFECETDRDDYLPHPERQAFVAALKPWLANVLVVDYATP